MNKMSEKISIIPMYTSKGDLGAFLYYPNIFNPYGEWIGWVTPEKEVYSVHGLFVGKLSKDLRILRKREWDFNHTRCHPPTSPANIRPPAHVPLAPQLSEVPINMIEVLQEAPDLLPPIDFGEGREDLD
jgi:hypothetical protein